MKKNNSKVFLLGFIVIALGAVGGSAAFFFKSGFFKTSGNSAIVDDKNVSYGTNAVQVFTEPPESDDVSYETVQPQEKSYSEITSYIGKEVRFQKDSDQVLVWGTSENHRKYFVSDFASRNDTIDEFIFDIVSEDADSDIGDFKNGFGADVRPGCKNDYVERNKWYHPSDEVVYIGGSEAQVTWIIPDDVKNYIDDKGQIQFGHWWSNVTDVRVRSIICLKSFVGEVRSDGVRSVEEQHVLDPDNVYSFAASELLNKKNDNTDGRLSSVSFHISGNSPLGIMKFNIIVKDKNGTEYNFEDLVQRSESEEDVITWVIPDYVSEKTDDHSIITFVYNSGDNETVTISGIDATYYID